MSNIKTTISTVAAVIFLPACLFAHAGMFDRYLEYSVSARALFFTTLFVQLILSAFSFGLLRKTRPFRLFKVTCWHWSKKWFYILFFLFLIPFVTLTIVDMDYVLLWLISGGSLLAVVITYAVCTYKLYVSNKRQPSWQKLYVTIILSTQQMLGYVLYLLTCNTDFMGKLFNYTDDEYQSFNYIIYPGIRILNNHVKGYVSMLITLLLWSLLLLLIIVASFLLKKRKYRKTNIDFV